MVNTLCDTVVQGEMAFSLEVEVRFINKKGLVKNNDIDCVMVIKILMIQSLIDSVNFSWVMAIVVNFRQ